MNSLQPNYPSNAACVQVTEFGDFGNPQSQQAHKLINVIVDRYGGEVTYRYCHYPNPDCKQSLLAAFALEAAKRQHQFQPMYGALLTASTIDCTTLIEQAIQLGFNQQQFMDDLADEGLRDVIKQDWEAGYRLGVFKSPAFFANGCRFYGKFSMSRLIPFVHFHLVRQRRPINPAPGPSPIQLPERLVYSRQ
ncbi:DsbA family protein [Spirosoma spitsbergense]|uniref:DsbA family protein n=1 Tax=Spirosoma spitsbergense TaxID=431554 RepID=UPI00036B0DC1|nr:thioredoxin domain-containing protein [Spirosoma spitsbergense]